MNLYEHLDFPAAPASRPYTFINMVCTVDGKTVSNTREEDVVGLGSKFDQLVMDRIEAAADAVLQGGQTLRATNPKWNPKAPIRIGVTRSGKVPFDTQYFSAPGSQAYLACPSRLTIQLPGHVTRINAGKDVVDPVWLAKYLRQEIGIERLHVLGGSEINALFLQHDLVDELFLTIAPKVKLGRELPTYAGGDPLPEDAIQNYQLVEHHAVADEMFLRYRRRWQS